MELKWSGDYLEVISPEGYEYECVHEPDMVLALPKVEDKYIIRKEVAPAYSVKGEDRKYWTMISGTVENGESPLETLRREMGEETPVKPNRVKLLSKKENFPVLKLTTSRASFYHFEVLDFDRTKAEGDGSKVERQSEYHFVSKDELKQVANSKACDFTIMYCSEIL